MNGDLRWMLSLGNSLCGVAILTLPHCFTRCGVVLGSLLLLGSGLLTLWSCQLLLKTAFSTGKFTYQTIAQDLFGYNGRLFIEIGILGLLIGTCAAFFVIVSDLAPVLVQHLTGIQLPLDQLRVLVPIALAVFVVFPLCLLRDLSNLIAISIVSLLFYITLAGQLAAMAMRVLFSSESPHVELWHIEGVFTSLPIFSLAFSCHLVLCTMLNEIHDPSFKQMNFIVSGAITLVAALYCSTALFGHVAFTNVGVEGDVLVNFGKGLFSELTRLGFTLSVLLSFPFFVNPLRSSINSFFCSLCSTGDSSPILSQNRHVSITVAIVIVTLTIALVTPNVEVVVGLTGAIAGSTVGFIFPALAYLYCPKSSRGSLSWNKTKAMVILVLGVSMLIIGSMAVTSAGPAEHVGEGEVKPVPDIAGNPMNDAGGVKQPLVDPAEGDHPAKENDKKGEGEAGGGKLSLPVRVKKNKTIMPELSNDGPGKANVLDSPPSVERPSIGPALSDDEQQTTENQLSLTEATLSPAKEIVADNQQVPNNQQQAPIDNQQAPIDNQQAPIGNQQAPIDNQQAPIDNQQAPIDNQQAPIGNQQAPIDNQQAPIGNQQDPLGNQQTSLGNQQGPLGNQQGPLSNQQAPIDNQQAPIGNQQDTLGNQQTSLGNQQGPLGNQQGPLSNQQAPIGNQQASIGNPLGNAQAPLGNQQAPLGNAQAPLGNAQAPLSNHQVPLGNHQVPLSNQQAPLGNQQALLGNAQAPLSNEQASLSDAKQLRTAATKIEH